MKSKMLTEKKVEEALAAWQAQPRISADDAWRQDLLNRFAEESKTIQLLFKPGLRWAAAAGIALLASMNIYAFLTQSTLATQPLPYAEALVSDFTNSTVDIQWEQLWNENHQSNE